MSIIEKLYYLIDCDEACDNPFETEKSREAAWEFDKKYNHKKTSEQPSEMWDDLMVLCSMERRRAFEVGYNTAIKLIIGGALD